MNHSKKLLSVLCTLLLLFGCFFSSSLPTEASNTFDAPSDKERSLMENAGNAMADRQSLRILDYEDNEATETVQKAAIVDKAGLDYRTIGVAVKDLDEDDYEYDVYRATSKNGTYKKMCTIKETDVTWRTYMGHTYVADSKGRVLYEKLDGMYVYYDQNVSFNKTYYYKVQARNRYTGRTGAYSNVVSCRSTLGAPTITKAMNKGSAKVKVNWSKVYGAQGYVLYRKDKGGWKKVSQLSRRKISYTDKKAKKGCINSYRIRAYRKVGSKKIYGSYSKIYKVALKNLKISGNYKKGSVYGPSLSTARLQEVRYVVQNFKLNYIKKGMSTYEKVLAAHNFICMNCEYAYRGWQYNNANTAWGALVYGEAQCSGYARAMKALCDAIGVPCRYVHANKKSANPSHQWNQVKVGGKWYIVDVQCNDTSGFFAFFLVSGNYYKSASGMRWDESKYPKTSKTNYVPK